MRQFAEDEIILPDGPYQGQRFRCRRQPFTGAYFDAVDSGEFQRIAATGPTQSGKSLLGSVIPVVYHLFETRETVIIGLPDLAMAGDKWSIDIRPVIWASRYRDLLPSRGGGSRSARNPVAVSFLNGATLRFMTAGGSDKSRAGYTSRIVVMSEIDGFDEASELSVETDKVSQIEARTSAYGPAKRIYMESTPSVPTGRIWREYSEGTCSELYVPCPHCGVFVVLKRECLLGWQEAKSVEEARDKAFIMCPACSAVWSEDERKTAHQDLVRLDRGCSISDGGKVTGERARTDTAGLRWNAANNILLPISEAASEEWRAKQAPDEEIAERKLKQFVWALPIDIGPQLLDTLTERGIASRSVADMARGRVPDDTLCLTMGVDVGKHLIHYTVLARLPEDGAHIVDAQRVEVASSEYGVERALPEAFNALYSRIQDGWGGHIPAAVWIDAGYQRDIVLMMCQRDPHGTWMPVKGLGWRQSRMGQGGGMYAPPKKSKLVKWVGEGFHIRTVPHWRGMAMAMVDADFWKSWVHDHLTVPFGEPGGMTLYTASEKDHLPLARHLLSERRVIEMVRKVGPVEKWINPTGRNNHWFDSTYMAGAASSFALAMGRRMQPQRKMPKAKTKTAAGRPDSYGDGEGRRYLITMREK